MTKQSKTPETLPESKARRPRRTLDDALKVKIVLEALKEAEPLAVIASRYEVHPTQISQWRKQFLASAVNAFAGDKSKDQELADLKAKNDEQAKMVGSLTMDVAFLKKSLTKLGIPF